MAVGEVSTPDLGRAGDGDSISTSQMSPGTVLVGHSLGAVLALRMASGSASIGGLIMTSGFYPPGRNEQSYAAALRATRSIGSRWQGLWPRRARGHGGVGCGR